MEIFSKEELIKKLIDIKRQGWILGTRQGNAGNVGNTIEDLLGIKENNLPIANAAEWELKTQRSTTSSLVTLTHMEPSPRALKFVPKILLPNYGWYHQEAGKQHGENEMSFRQTISGLNYSDRGFKIIVDRNEHKVLVTFNSTVVGKRHSTWLKHVEDKIGLGELNPQPYWGFGRFKKQNCCKAIKLFLCSRRCKARKR